jgi:hypothetical protein
MVNVGVRLVPLMSPLHPLKIYPSELRLAVRVTAVFLS